MWKFNSCGSTLRIPEVILKRVWEGEKLKNALYQVEVTRLLKDDLAKVCFSIYKSTDRGIWAKSFSHSVD